MNPRAGYTSFKLAKYDINMTFLYYNSEYCITLVNLILYGRGAIPFSAGIALTILHKDKELNAIISTLKN